MTDFVGLIFSAVTYAILTLFTVTFGAFLWVVLSDFISSWRKK